VKRFAEISDFATKVIFASKSKHKRRWTASGNRKTLLGPQFSSPLQVPPGSPGETFVIAGGLR
jgi:hypothetical protein